MRGTRVLLSSVPLVAALAPGAGAAVVNANIVVADDLSACASFDVVGADVVAGTFSAAGVVSGPGTITVPVAGARPVAVSGDPSWRGCIAGAYVGGTRGLVEYVLQLHSADEDVVISRSCEVRSGVVTCS